MKRLFTVFIVLAAMVLSANAQGFGNFQPPTPEQATERMAEQLMLTSDQGDKVFELNKQYPELMMMYAFPRGGGNFGGGQQGSRPQQGADTDAQSGATQQAQRPQNSQPRQRPELTEEQKAKFEEMRQKREQYEAKLKEILTAEQSDKYDELYHRGFGQGGRNGHGHGHAEGDGHNHENHGNHNGHNKDKGDKDKSKKK